MFKIAQEDDLAERVLDRAKACQEKLEKNFSVKIEFDSETVATLKEISGLYNAGPIEVTPELISRTAHKR
ncbi:hypothetical protein [Pacificibacter sp. AS14]|uniref:hypothetical protein n=1 Tax=Pacificibacter sp. AS14 TaxID=3135785 RepID=UPI00317FD746